MSSLLRTIERAALKNNPQLWRALPKAQRKQGEIKRINGYCVSAIQSIITSRKTKRQLAEKRKALRQAV